MEKPSWNTASGLRYSNLCFIEYVFVLQEVPCYIGWVLVVDVFTLGSVGVCTIGSVLVGNARSYGFRSKRSTQNPISLTYDFILAWYVLIRLSVQILSKVHPLFFSSLSLLLFITAMDTTRRKRKEWGEIAQH